ncbi:MAG: hypothetical protein ACI9T7_002462, partial [Oleiphilaceae bacterium]
MVDRSKNNKRDMPMAYARKLIQRFFSLTVLTLLLATVVAGTSENMNAQMLKLGIHIWDDYFILRGEEPKSSCNPNPVIDEQLDLLQTEFDQENADFDLLADEFDRDSARTSLVKQLRVCAKKHDNAAIYHENNSVWVQLFSS